MLRISKKADYAVFLLGAIARQGAFPGGSAEDSVVSAHEIAKQAGLNKSVVANLLKEFTRHGLCDSVRGLRGGYRLTRAPADISLGEILEVVEGKFTLVDCIQDTGSRAQAAPDASLLPQAPSMLRANATNGRAVDAPEAGTNGHDCSLIAFCPSKQPMRIVHQRISRLFAEIRLDELCAMSPTADTSAR